jgi:hypothetical protein
MFDDGRQRAKVLLYASSENGLSCDLPKMLSSSDLPKPVKS